MDYTLELSENLLFLEEVLTKCGDIAYFRILQENGNFLLSENNSMILLENQFYFAFIEEPIDSLSILETLANKPTLKISDNQIFSESLIKMADKILVDELNILEDIILSFILSLSDIVNLADAEIETIGLFLSDFLTVSETLANQTSLRITDIISFTEELLKYIEFNRQFIDAQTIIEDTVFVFDVLREYSDSQSIIDLISKKPSLIKADNIGIVAGIPEVYKIIRKGDTAFARSHTY